MKKAFFAILMILSLSACGEDDPCDGFSVDHASCIEQETEINSESLDYDYDYDYPEYPTDYESDFS